MIDRTGCPGRPGAHDPIRVGTAAAYRSWGCMCEDARAASRGKRKRRSHGIPTPPHEGAVGNRWGYDVPGVATNRRLQALACIGWSSSALAARLGCHPSLVQQWRRNRTVTVTTERRVADLYRELSDTPGGDRRATGWARKMGFAPPIAWDPDTISDPDATPQHLAQDSGALSTNTDVDLELALAGRLRIPSSPYRHSIHLMAVSILGRRISADGRPWGAEQIAAHLGISYRQVQRLRAELRAAEQTQHDETPTPTQKEAA